MQIEIHGPGWRFPTYDPHCLSVLTYLRLGGLLNKIIITPSNRIGLSYENRLPVLHVDSNTHFTAEEIFDYFEDQNDLNLNKNLSIAQRAESFAFRSVVEDRINAYLTYELYNNLNFPFINSILSKNSNWPFPFNYVEPIFLKNYARNKLEFINSPLLDSDFVCASLTKYLKRLSDRLGDQKYFFGDQATALDASVFGYLAIPYFNTLNTSFFRDELLKYENLCHFLDRIGKDLYNVSKDDKVVVKVDWRTNLKWNIAVLGLFGAIVGFVYLTGRQSSNK